MKKLILIVIVAAAAWFGIQKFLMKAKDTTAGQREGVNKSEKFLKDEMKQDGK